MSAAHAENDHKWPKRDANAVTLRKTLEMPEKYVEDVLRSGRWIGDDGGKSVKST